MFALWSTSLPFGICPFLQSTVLYFSGQRIWDAIITDLLGKGLARAEKVPPSVFLATCYARVTLASSA